MTAKRMTVVRNGRVLDIKGHRAPAADILIAGDTIARDRASGPRRAGRCRPRRRHRPADPSGPDQRPHPRPRQSEQGHGRPLDAGAAAHRRALDQRQPHGRGQVSLHLHRRARDADEGLHRLLRPDRRVSRSRRPRGSAPAPRPTPTPACARWWRRWSPSLTFYEAIPGLLDVLPPALQKEVERLRLAPYEASLTAMRRVLTDWSFDRELVRPAVAPTIPHHCSDEFMTSCASLAREFGVGLHTHVQESKAQVIVGLKKYGKTPTAHLQDLGLLGPDFVAAHGVWLDDDDIARLADHGASVAHNPGSNMLLGNGIAAVRSMLDRKLNVGIGTDGASCCDNQNMYESLRVAAYGSNAQGARQRPLARERGDPRGGHRRQRPRARLRRQASAGSPRATRPTSSSSTSTHINWIPCNDPTNQLVHTEDGSAVHSVMVGGRMVVENRRPVGLDFARSGQEGRGRARAAGGRQRRQQGAVRAPAGPRQRLLPGPRQDALPHRPLRRRPPRALRELCSTARLAPLQRHGNILLENRLQLGQWRKAETARHTNCVNTGRLTRRRLGCLRCTRV